MGCGGSKVDLDTFLVPQTEGHGAPLLHGVVGDSSRPHRILKCANFFDLTYGVDGKTSAGRADPMKLTWDGKAVATIESQASSLVGNISFNKVWSSTVVCKDASGKIVAKMSREWIKKEAKLAAGEWRVTNNPDVYAITQTTICSAEPRVDGQAAAADGMFPCALLKARVTAKQAEEGDFGRVLHGGNYPSGGVKDFATFHGQLSVYPVASDGVSFVEEPLMVICPLYEHDRVVHIMNGDASQGLGVTSVFTITPAQGVDPVLMALVMLEFKMRAGPYGMAGRMM